LTLLAGHQEEHPAYKNQVVRCHFLPIISCIIKIQIGLTFLVLAYPGYPGKEAVKQVSV